MTHAYEIIHRSHRKKKNGKKNTHTCMVKIDYSVNQLEYDLWIKLWVDLLSFSNISSGHDEHRSLFSECTFDGQETRF